MLEPTAARSITPVGTLVTQAVVPSTRWLGLSRESLSPLEDERDLFSFPDEGSRGNLAESQHCQHRRQQRQDTCSSFRNRRDSQHSIFRA